MLVVWSTRGHNCKEKKRMAREIRGNQSFINIKREEKYCSEFSPESSEWPRLSRISQNRKIQQIQPPLQKKYCCIFRLKKIIKQNPTSCINHLIHGHFSLLQREYTKFSWAWWTRRQAFLLVQKDHRVAIHLFEASCCEEVLSSSYRTTWERMSIIPLMAVRTYKLKPVQVICPSLSIHQIIYLSFLNAVPLYPITSRNFTSKRRKTSFVCGKLSTGRIKINSDMLMYRSVVDSTLVEK